MMTKLEKKAVLPGSLSRAEIQMRVSDFSTTPDPGATGRPVTESVAVGARKSRARLTVAEKAFARGLKALRDRNYPEAKRQLAGFLELMGHHARPNAGELTLHRSHSLQGLRVVVEALELLLAISEEITILEQDGR